jgi:hypothetical protein
VTPHSAQGVTLLGEAGAAPHSVWLAGTEIPVTLFFQSSVAAPSLRSLRLGLRRGDAEVTAWEGWPLPEYPPATWPAGALVQVPAGLQLPGDMAAGEYDLTLGIGGTQGGASVAPATLARVTVTRRAASFMALQSAHRLDPPVQFGTHVELIGYTLLPAPDALTVELDWHVLQALLPPHQIFIHLTAADGTRLGQADGTPQTAAGPAPTGSWLPGEYLRTVHHLSLPDGLSTAQGSALRVGLYIPVTGVRLPAARAGAPSGDAAQIPLP